MSRNRPEDSSTQAAAPAGGIRWLLILLMIVATALAARVDLPVPGSPVPISGQTLAVLLAGGWLGARDGVLAMALYVAAGSMGLPVFAGGAAGSAVLLGPSGGYLTGFLVAAGLMGMVEERQGKVGLSPLRPVLITFLFALLAHALILTLGGFRLATLFGPESAWSDGVQPFLVGGVIKAALATLLIRWAGGRWLPRAQ
ncbi:MAG: biotin transporter BioY [Acidobacteriota bacterium]